MIASRRARMSCVRMAGATVGLTVWITGVHVIAQVIGDEAEMERLQTKAEDAMAVGDPDGAAMSAGKAALMAAQLAKRQRSQAAAQWYRGAEALFRAQEHAYRAQALFQRAGGQLPASSGVCGSLAMAKQQIGKAENLLVDAVPSKNAPMSSDNGPKLYAVAVEWVGTIDGQIAELQCR